MERTGGCWVEMQKESRETDFFFSYSTVYGSPTKLSLLHTHSHIQIDTQQGLVGKGRRTERKRDMFGEADGKMKALIVAYGPDSVCDCVCVFVCVCARAFFHTVKTNFVRVRAVSV